MGITKKFVWIPLMIISSLSSICAKANSFDSSEWRKIVTPLQYPNPAENTEAQLYDERQKGENGGDYKQKQGENGEQYQIEPAPQEDRDSSIDLSGVNVVLYILLGVLFVFFIVKIFQIQLKKNRNKGKGSKVILVDENPEELIKNELDSGLTLALKSANYNAALRYLFLQVLERLQHKGLIEWNKYKTNGEYLQELESAAYFVEMRSFTFDYEYFWFGEYNLVKTEFEVLQIKFSELIKAIEHA